MTLTMTRKLKSGALTLKTIVLLDSSPYTENAMIVYRASLLSRWFVIPREMSPNITSPTVW